jgi:glycosyltransferase involved in cell wall biosynthesis
LLAEEVTLHLLLDGRQAALDIDLPQHDLAGPLSGRGAAWLQLAVPRWLRHFDGVFHCPFYGLPFLQPTPMVVTIHDLTFEDHPEWFTAARRLAFRVQARHAARTAARVVTDSTHVRDEVQRRYGVETERLVVAPYAVDRRFESVPTSERVAATLDRLGVGPPYVLALGGAPRRQLRVAVDAWRRARRPDGTPNLVVVGAERPSTEQGVVWVGRVPDDDWAALLVGADAFCYSTAEEGFGMPAVEAATVGAPVVCARVGSLPEVLGDAAEWCDRPDGPSLAAGLSRVLGDPARAERLRAAGRRQQADRPTWADAAAVLVRAYTEAAGRG